MHIKFPDGSVWLIDRHKVASSYARFYSEEVTDPIRKEEVYDIEYVRIIEDEDIFRDWLYSDMNWEDLNAVMVEPPTVDYANMFQESELIWED